MPSARTAHTPPSHPIRAIAKCVARAFACCSSELTERSTTTSKLRPTWRLRWEHASHEVLCQRIVVSGNLAWSSLSSNCPPQRVRRDFPTSDIVTCVDFAWTICQKKRKSINKFNNRLQQRKISTTIRMTTTATISATSTDSNNNLQVLQQGCKDWQQQQHAQTSSACTF